MGSTRRLFVALVLGAELGARVAAATRGALGVRPDSARDEGLRLDAAADLHLTLFFLGAVSSEFQGELEELLAANLEGQRAPRLWLTSGGAFPAPGRERILWVGLEEVQPGPLRELQERVSEACVAAGFRAEERAWRPHVTIGRVQRSRRGRSPSIPEAFYRLDLREEWKPRAVRIVESVGGPAGRSYPSIRSFPLSAE